MFLFLLWGVGVVENVFSVSYDLQGYRLRDLGCAWFLLLRLELRGATTPTMMYQQKPQTVVPVGARTTYAVPGVATAKFAQASTLTPRTFQANGSCILLLIRNRKAA